MTVTARDGYRAITVFSRSTDPNGRAHTHRSMSTDSRPNCVLTLQKVNVTPATISVFVSLCLFGFVPPVIVAESIDHEQLISLVETRPVLRNKTLDKHRDKNATRNAGREICNILNPEFEEIEDNKKNYFGENNELVHSTINFCCNF